MHGYGQNVAAHPNNSQLTSSVIFPAFAPNISPEDLRDAPAIKPDQASCERMAKYSVTFPRPTGIPHQNLLKGFSRKIKDNRPDNTRPGSHLKRPAHLNSSVRRSSIKRHERTSKEHAQLKICFSKRGMPAIICTDTNCRVQIPYRDDRVFDLTARDFDATGVYKDWRRTAMTLSASTETPNIIEGFEQGILLPTMLVRRFSLLAIINHSQHLC